MYPGIRVSTAPTLLALPLIVAAAEVSTPYEGLECAIVKTLARRKSERTPELKVERFAPAYFTKPKHINVRNICMYVHMYIDSPERLE